LTCSKFDAVLSNSESVGRHHDHRHQLVDQRDRAVLHLPGGIALGVDVGDLLQLKRALERDREVHVPRPR
jgi:hypothetical protein